jgi:class 3 adenylate cyclase
VTCGKPVVKTTDKGGPGNGVDKIAQGFATIGAIGFEGRRDYSAIGTVSNLASRLCDEAKGCEILITQKVLSCIDGLVEAEPLKPLTLKGLAHPVPAFNIVRLKT